MLIFPAIDLYHGQVVRLYKGNYEEMTVYHPDPVSVAKNFQSCGAKHIHIVDLEGARNGTAPNLDIITGIVKETGLFAEVGGGIRSMEIIQRYFDAGVSRVILGTAAVCNPALTEEAVHTWGNRIAVGIDLRDGLVSIRGWTETTELTAIAFAEQMRNIGIDTMICTDIGRDGAMQGSNIALYKELSEALDMKIIASGGVSSMPDIVTLREMGLHGAIIGKAYYTGAINLREAIGAAK